MAPATLEGKNLGKYRVLEPLGRGGMAQVYRAYHPQLDRYLAIKVLRSDLVEEAEFLARFQREARAVAGLRHPNIVQIYDFDVQDDLYYMAIELLDGDSLKARLNRYRTQGAAMPFGEVARILLDVLGGLGYAHSEGVIHRDIKPANIMLNRRGQAIITDFGIAQIIGGTQYTLSGALMGTLNYMAPEQGLHGRTDARSDLYSLGIVFYEMVTGKPPFDADTPLAILMKHLNDPLPLPRQLNPALPEPFERVLLKALAKNPEDRYQNAAEMADALQGAVAEAAIILPEPILEPAKPNPPQVSPSDAETAEAVAVFSGAARQHIPDVSFASDDTDARLSQHFIQKPASQSEAQPQAVSTAANSFAKSVLAAVIASFRAGMAPEADSHAPAAERAVNSRPVVSAMITFGFTLLAFNLGAVVIGLFTHSWGVFGYGWPFEIFLVSMGLSLLMSALPQIWIFVPAGLLMGNAILMSYYSLTGRWQNWAFLWPLEPALFIAIPWLTIGWSRRPEFSRWLARRMGAIMAVVAVVYGLLTIGVSFIVGLTR